MPWCGREKNISPQLQRDNYHRVAIVKVRVSWAVEERATNLHWTELVAENSFREVIVKLNLEGRMEVFQMDRRGK